MNFDKKRRIKFYYDAAAKFYRKRYYNIQLIKHGIILKKIINGKFLVIDVGCGIGSLCRILSLKGFRVIGVDFSIEMLREAKKSSQSPNISFLCCDSDFLPFRSDIFTGAFSVTLLQNLPNSALSLSEMIRVCKKESTLHLSVLSKSLGTKGLKTLLSKAGLKDVEVWGTFGSEDVYGCGKV